MLAKRRSLGRGIGAAFAVLALYILTLLVPLHQAAGLQRDLDALGFATVDSWSVCVSIAQDEDGKPVSAAQIKCPAASIGQAFAGGMPPVFRWETRASPEILRFALSDVPDRRGDHPLLAQPRGPPLA